MAAPKAAAGERRLSGGWAPARRQQQRAPAKSQRVETLNPKTDVAQRRLKAEQDMFEITAVGRADGDQKNYE